MTFEPTEGNNMKPPHLPSVQRPRPTAAHRGPAAVGRAGGRPRPTAAHPPYVVRGGAGRGRPPTRPPAALAADTGPGPRS